MEAPDKMSTRSITNKKKLNQNGGQADELPTLRGIFIRGFGEIVFPLNYSNGNALIKSDAIINNQLSTSEFEIGPLKIEIRNPKWNNYLEQLVKRVSVGLGFFGKVEAKFHKMLIFKPGGINFHHSKQTDKRSSNERTFARLVLNFPGKH